ncbi:MAG: peptidoglycan D,D-transpeptidase FtsI family protein [Gammaproteobacteria bacterium]
MGGTISTSGFRFWRLLFVLIMLGVLSMGVLGRMLYLQLIEQDFLQDQGDMRSVRTVSLTALRGIITDRLGEPLAVSTPVDSIWANPHVVEQATSQQIAQLAAVLDIPVKELATKLAQAKGKEFLYLKRQLSPQEAEQVLALAVPGINAQREYRRYYPMGEAAAHIVGLVNVDGHGVEGLELAFDHHLRGHDGKMEVLKDRRGQIVQDLALLKTTEQGKPLALSIDNRLQYIAHRELKAAVKETQAVGGSVVIVDVKTGEILAMVNQPSYNPNNREKFIPDHMRNRAVTDVFEPGSTAKPFAVLTTLRSGKENPDNMIETSPGYMNVSGRVVRDIHNYGRISLTDVLRKSSNVGIAKIILPEPQEKLLDIYKSLGFGQSTYLEFPGERSGYLEASRKMDPFMYATLAFGYGVSTTAVQLAKSYAILANDGKYVPFTLLKRDDIPKPEQVMAADEIKTLRDMLIIYPKDGGSGDTARVKGYLVGGKTGTVRKLGPNGYLADHHLATFVGFAPATTPRLVCVVVIDDPAAGQYYGGAVSAPVFGKIMSDALRLRDIPLDDENAYIKGS